MTERGTLTEFARFECNCRRFRDLKFLGMEFLFTTMKVYV